MLLNVVWILRKYLFHHTKFLLHTNFQLRIRRRTKDCTICQEYVRSSLFHHKIVNWSRRDIYANIKSTFNDFCLNAISVLFFNVTRENVFQQGEKSRGFYNVIGKKSDKVFQLENAFQKTVTCQMSGSE